MPTIRSPREKEASEAIYLAKGLAMVLVLIGHFGPANWWSESFRQCVAVIYLFHMPLFMMLSGYLSALRPTDSARRAQSLFGWSREEWRRRSVRFLLPYLSVQLVYIALKLMLRPVFDYGTIDVATLAAVFVRPADSPASLMWFIYTLFLLTLVYPALRRGLRDAFWVLLVACGVFFVPTPALFALDRVAYYLPFYALGALLAERRWLECREFSKTVLGATLGFGALASLALAADLFQWMPLRLLAGASGAVAVLGGTVLAVRQGAAPPVLRMVGVHSASVYFFHQPVVWGVAVLAARGFHLSGDRLLLVLPFAVLAGAGLPILFDRVVLTRSPTAALLFSGRPIKTARTVG